MCERTRWADLTCDCTRKGCMNVMHIYVLAARPRHGPISHEIQFPRRNAARAHDTSPFCWFFTKAHCRDCRRAQSRRVNLALWKFAFSTLTQRATQRVNYHDAHPKHLFARRQRMSERAAAVIESIRFSPLCIERCLFFVFVNMVSAGPWELN
jgi:hypothetical protein